VYLRSYLTRALTLSLSLFRPDLFHSPCSLPLVSPHARATTSFRTGPSFLSFPLATFSRCSLDLCSIRALLRTRHPAYSHDVPVLVARFIFSLFISLPFLSFFFFSPQHAPGRRVIFIICYLLRTPPAVVVCPARPTRKNRKIEENKSGRRGAPRIPRGGALGQRAAGSSVGRENRNG